MQRAPRTARSFSSKSFRRPIAQPKTPAHAHSCAIARPTRHGFDYWYGLPYSNDMDWADGVSFDEVLAMRASGRGEDIQALYERRRARYQAKEERRRAAFELKVRMRMRTLAAAVLLAVLLG